MFELHPRLVKDCIEVGDFPLSKVMLLNDCHYPWVILVPKRQSIQEIYELSPIDQQQLVIESSAVSAAMAEHFSADKMNVAALGNMVPQLHIHHIVRYKSDAAWPKPVWGVVNGSAYAEEKLADQLHVLRKILLPLGMK
ncbi:MAG: HIT domain-containing protein [Oceanicoccus sp.]